MKAGQFRAVNVQGEAGIGKSRLIFEFGKSLRDEPMLQLEAICRPEGTGIPFLPLTEVMRSWVRHRGRRRDPGGSGAQGAAGTGASWYRA